MQYNYLISVGLTTTGWQLGKMADYVTTLGLRPCPAFHGLWYKKTVCVHGERLGMKLLR